jgi:rod shape-determining protein MreC
MPKTRISYINKDILALFVTSLISIIILLSNTSPQINKLKLQLSWTVSKISSPMSWYKNVFSIKEENSLLKNKLVQLSLINSELESYRQENKRLKDLLNFADDQVINYRTANVVNYHFGITNQTIIIDMGLLDSLTNNLPIMDENGLLGKTISISDHASLIQLITDKNIRVSIRVGYERALGIFMPTHGKYGILEGVRKTTPLKIGDIAYTSGISEIYPDNIPVAKIISISNQIEKPFQKVIVEILGSITDLDFVFIML